MINLPNGEKLEFLASSGALAFDGRGWLWEWPFRWFGLLNPKAFHIVVKTLTLQPRKGNLKWYQPWGCVRLIKNGTVNAVGLTNPGLMSWIKNQYPRMLKLGYKIIVSVFVENEQEAIEIARLLVPLKIAAIELNVSCPNTEHEIEATKHVKMIAERLKQSGHPLIVKISINQPYKLIAKELEGTADAIHAINSVAWKSVFSSDKSPLEKLGGGGVSGPIIRKYTRKAVTSLAKESTLPIIAGGGVYTIEDVDELFELGASAISFGTLFLKSPSSPNQIVNNWRKQTHYNSAKNVKAKNPQI